ncbi:MAG: phosphoribosylamine--glycine ligase, partial [Chlamydiia bacterium]|nr:phosphoribosylamine--glycine ligase [Chlamydiia bacterium]
GFAQLAESLEVDLTVVGPEQPLEEGIANHFRRLKLPIFAPTKEAAKLESSKAYAKDFMHKYGVPTARYKVCRDPESAYLAAEEFCRGDGAVVIKPSGLTAGKGVTVCHSLEAARTAIDLIMTQASYGNAGAELVVEECLEGQEVSILTFCDGIRMVPMPPAQDHKTLCDGDTGPNTGGMGAYAPTPCVNDRLLAEIQAHVIDRTQHGLRLEGISYTGVLYFGLMLTSKGPRVLEYNCR